MAQRERFGQDSSWQEERLRVMIPDAFPTSRASDALRQRIAALATTAGKPSLTGAPWGRRIRRATSILIFAAGAAAAIRYFLYRPGEQAIRFMPADALCVVTLDTIPSPTQAPLFLRLERAMQREKLDGALAQGIRPLLDKMPIARDLRPYLARSFGVATFAAQSGAKPGRQRPGITLTTDAERNVKLIANANINFAPGARSIFYGALLDEPAVRRYLNRHGRSYRIGNLDAWNLPTQHLDVMLMAGYLVATAAPELLPRVEQVYAGKAQSVSELPEYRAARAAVPGDANLMVFVAPTAMDRLQQASCRAGVNAFRNTRWMALSTTLQNNGLRFDLRLPPEDSDAQGPSHIADIAPLNDVAYRRLPTRAYGVIGLSQPGRCWDALTASIFGTPQERRAFDLDLAAAERVFGLSLKRDVLPAFEGNNWLGIYPDPASETGLGAVIVMDDAHHATPAHSFVRWRNAVERAFGPGNRKQVNGYQFMPRTAQILNRRWGWPLPDSSDTEAEATHEQEDQVDQADGQEDAQSEQDSQGIPRLVSAQVGQGLIWASSRPLLDRALAAYRGAGKTLADDPPYAGMRHATTAHAQDVLMIDLRRALESLRPYLNRQLKARGTKLTAADLVGLFGQDTNGLTISSHYDGEVTSATLFLPLDYERAIHLIGAIKATDTGLPLKAAKGFRHPATEQNRTRK